MQSVSRAAKAILIMIRIPVIYKYARIVLPQFIIAALVVFTCQITADEISKENIFIKPRPSVTALRVEAPPVIDGELDEGVWQQASIGGDFIQYEPFDGIKMSERTEFRILYDDNAIYIGITQEI